MEKLLDAAEILFVERGVLGAPVRDITVAAGQRNASAMHYHFGSREGLVAAILARGQAAVVEDRALMLGGVTGELHLINLIRGIVVPLANRLGSSSGCRYLAILEQCLTTPELHSVEHGFDDSIAQIKQKISTVLKWVPEHILQRRFNFIVGALVSALAHRARVRLVSGELDDTDAIFVDDLVEMLAAAISAPLPLFLK
jgi:TetR/AcrR family transcriptional regulator, regulator of cefoperazone and chloramphenicol sensitivity